MDKLDGWANVGRGITNIISKFGVERKLLLLERRSDAGMWVF